MNADNTRQQTADMPGILKDDRPLPHDITLEKAVLGAILVSPDECLNIAMEILDADTAFYSPTHREIYKTIMDIYNSGAGTIDIITLAHELKVKNILTDIGGELYLTDLETSVTTTVHMEQWCKILRDYALLRTMIATCAQALDACYEFKEDASEIFDHIERDILAVRDKELQSQIVTIRELAKPTFQYLHDLMEKKIEPGIPTGFPDLDKKIIGLRRGEMFVLAARPSIGKTALALNIIRNIALRGERSKPVAFFSLEMTAEQIARRLLCTEANVSEKDIFEHTVKGTDITRLTQAASVFKKAKIFIDPTPGIKVSQLRAKARSLRIREKIELIVIDYLQLMHGDYQRSDNRQQEVSDISHGIKTLAKELNIPILVLAQLNREVEKATSKKARPKLSHLRESGAIEQDADVVAFLHRERDSQKDLSREAQIKGLDAELIIEKNRNGETGIVPLLFFPKRMLFSSKSKYSEQDEPKKQPKTK